MMPYFETLKQTHTQAPFARLEILHDFDAISLKEMDEVRMMNRFDSKFLLKKELLERILEEIKDDYFVLEAAGTRIQSYNTIYYDTSDDRFYLEHHNGYTRRMKLRKREYSDSGDVFLEIKLKNNKGQTRKKRMETTGLDKILSEEETIFIKQNTSLNGEKLEPKFNSWFKRITLVSKKFDERCTIDTDLHFHSYCAEKSDLQDMVIVELKQERQNVRSKLAVVLKENKVYKQAFSKYCLGRALNESSLKSNVFKEGLAQIKSQLK